VILDIDRRTITTRIQTNTPEEKRERLARQRNYGTIHNYRQSQGGRKKAHAERSEYLEANYGGAMGPKLAIQREEAVGEGDLGVSMARG
jgi:hypothetical protein